MNDPSVTKFGYVRQIFGSLRKHRGEPALVLICVITISVVYLWAAARLHLRASDLTHDLAIGLVGSLLPLVATMLLLQFVVAAWRVYRNQQIAIATKQTLLDLDEFDREESEQKLRAHYVHCEERIQQRYEAQVKTLTENIAALTTRLRSIGGP